MHAQVRFLFQENTLINGEAGELQADEKEYVASAWKQRTGTKRIVEELNKRRAAQRRGGKVRSRASIDGSLAISTVACAPRLHNSP